MRRAIVLLLAQCLLLGGAVAAVKGGKDVGGGHDHRTFHANGTVDYGQIGTSRATSSWSWRN